MIEPTKEQHTACAASGHLPTEPCNDGFAKTCLCGARLHYESREALRKWQAHHAAKQQSAVKTAR